MTEVNEQINELLNKFDFARVQAAMTVLGWKWANETDNAVPSISELRTEAQELLEHVAVGGIYEACSGGLQARRHQYANGRLELILEFVLSFSTSSDLV